jgi:predicted Rossmann fold nucleotide-binding protein DprA/Smf involved in DNA uptake
MDRPFAFGVVGSRRRNTLHDRKIVFRLIAWLYGQHRGSTGFTIVSGGCPKGADAFAKEFCKLGFEPGLDYFEFPIDKTGVENKWEFTKRAFARNRLVAEKSWSGIFCLVSEDRTGGTENTIQHALDLQVPVYLVLNSGEVFLSKDGSLPKCDPVVRLLDLKSTD